MSLPALSVRRPVTAMMACVGAVLIGLISWSRLPQELFPPITYPQVSVVTFYKDAAPEEIEILITRLIEEQLGTVSGVRRISSTSQEERSLVIADFNWNTHMDFAALNVREKVDLIKERLPRGAEDPIVIKYNPFELPVMVLNVTGERSAQALLEITRKAIKSEIEKVDGVASASLSGGIEREILVELDQGRLVATGTSVVQVVDALSKANLNYPAGTIKETFYEQLIRTMGEFELVGEIRELPVQVDEGESAFEENPYEGLTEEEVKRLKEKNQKLILVKDIGEVRDTTKDRTSISRHNGRENISLSIQKKAGTNTVQIADRIKEAVAALRADLPKDISIEVVYDQSGFVKESLQGVVSAALQGGVLAFFVLLLFLRSVKSAAVVAVTIPVSVLVTFALMYFQGITLNMISLGGLALGVGMLVDNGIVVIENIMTRRQAGDDPVEASISGAAEVGGAITSSTLTTVVVFLPMIFVVGIAGQIFKELALTVTYSLLASLAVAVVFIPPVMRRLLERQGAVVPAGVGGQVLTGVRSVFREALILFLNFKPVGLLVIAVLFGISAIFLAGVDREFLPRVDQGQFVVKVGLLPGTKLEVTDEVVRKIEGRLLSTPEVSDVTVNVGSEKEKTSGNILETLDTHQAQILVSLIPKAQLWGARGPGVRTASTQEVIQGLMAKLKEESLKGAEIEFVAQESVFQSAFTAGKPIVIEVLGQDLLVLERVAEGVEEGLRRIDGVYGVRSSLAASSPETKVNVIKDRATSYRLSVSDIALTAQTAIKGYTATQFKEGGREIDIRVRLREEDRKSLSKVRRVTVHSPLGVDVPLSEVAYLSIGKGPTEIKRQDQQRVVVVSADIYGRSLSDIGKDVETMLTALGVPEGTVARLAGESQETRESFRSLVFALALSVILVYMIMAAQFESLWQPFVIMFTIPLSLIGVVFALLLTDTPLSVMVILGVIILGGIVVNNGIILIDVVNRLREKGRSALDAVVEANSLRIRPILMTSGTTVLGLLPLALGINKGGELQVPMAITVMGGLTVSAFLSLVVVPSVYLMVNAVMEWMGSGLKGQGRGEAADARAPVAEGGISRRDVESTRPLRREEIKVTDGDIYMAPPPEEEPKPISRVEEPERTPAPAEPAPPEPPPEPMAAPVEPAEERDPKTGLNPRQAKFLEDLKIFGRMTRYEYAELYRVSVPTAARDLKELQDKGLVKGHGPLARGRHYTLPSDPGQKPDTSNQ